eukprot:TRINITY_DN2083_c0_g1_i1.p1 TRINITY_DN2083_c0_g1~~TRINITY_DN2083_c0_g1_i1.p1  ORF type:complete len:440 (-),score=92.33 TRINITY_DN2083_c0_g1_i1:214-1485(-)
MTAGIGGTGGLHAWSSPVLLGRTSQSPPPARCASDAECQTSRHPPPPKSPCSAAENKVQRGRRRILRPLMRLSATLENFLVAPGDAAGCAELQGLLREGCRANPLRRRDSLELTAERLFQDAFGAASNHDASSWHRLRREVNLAQREATSIASAIRLAQLLLSYAQGDDAAPADSTVASSSSSSSSYVADAATLEAPRAATCATASDSSCAEIRRGERLRAAQAFVRSLFADDEVAAEPPPATSSARPRRRWSRRASRGSGEEAHAGSVDDAAAPAAAAADALREACAEGGLGLACGQPAEPDDRERACPQAEDVLKAELNLEENDYEEQDDDSDRCTPHAALRLSSSCDGSPLHKRSYIETTSDDSDSEDRSTARPSPVSRQTYLEESSEDSERGEFSFSEFLMKESERGEFSFSEFVMEDA